MTARLNLFRIQDGGEQARDLRRLLLLQLDKKCHQLCARELSAYDIALGGLHRRANAVLSAQHCVRDVERRLFTLGKPISVLLNKFRRMEPRERQQITTETVPVQKQQILLVG